MLPHRSDIRHDLVAPSFPVEVFFCSILLFKMIGAGCWHLPREAWWNWALVLLEALSKAAFH